MKRRQELEAFLSQRGKRPTSSQLDKNVARSKVQTPTQSCKPGDSADAPLPAPPQTFGRRQQHSGGLKNAPKLPRFGSFGPSHFQSADATSSTTRRTTFAASSKEPRQSGLGSLAQRSHLAQINNQPSEMPGRSPGRSFLYLGDATLSESVGLATELGLMSGSPPASELSKVDTPEHGSSNLSVALDELLKLNDRLLKLKEDQALREATETIAVCLHATPYVRLPSLGPIEMILKNSERIVLALKRPKCHPRALPLDPKYHQAFHQALSQTVKLLKEHDAKVARQGEVLHSICSQRARLVSILARLRFKTFKVRRSDQLDEIVSLMRRLDDYSAEFQLLVSQTTFQVLVGWHTVF
ncbi:hypothetical protein L0F63_001790 [Massospora cicadina]|nr:hypothetical protein L0F63_001790 [Massospora cicadina]